MWGGAWVSRNATLFELIFAALTAHDRAGMGGRDYDRVGT